MFNRKVLNDRIGKLKKSKALDDLEAVEGYIIRKSSENNIETSYDVMAEEMPYFKTMAYTEFATCFYLQPLNAKIRNEMMIDAWRDNVKDPSDWTSYLVVLPGSNKVKSNICLNRLRELKRIHGDNIYFKPHPITTHQIIGEMKDFFGEDCVLPRHADVYYYLQKAKTVYTTHISESALYATVLGKRIEPIDIWNNIMQGSFACINTHLFDHQHNTKEYIDKVFSSYKSGIINPVVDKDWKKKVDQYFDYICKKRDIYKSWYITTVKKKVVKK